jgi:hypothetical protein
MRRLPFLSSFLLSPILPVLPGGALAQDVAAPEGRPADSTFPAPWGVPLISDAGGSGFSFGGAVWSPDVDATMTDRWDTTLTLTQEGLGSGERTAEDFILDGEDAGAFEIRENTFFAVWGRRACGILRWRRYGECGVAPLTFVGDYNGVSSS